MKLSKNRINKLLKSKKQTRKKYNKKRKPAPKRKQKNTKNNKKIVNLRTKSLKRKPIRFYKSVESGGADGADGVGVPGSPAITTADDPNKLRYVTPVASEEATTKEAEKTAAATEETLPSGNQPEAQISEDKYIEKFMSFDKSLYDEEISKEQKETSIINNKILKPFNDFLEIILDDKLLATIDIKPSTGFTTDFLGEETKLISERDTLRKNLDNVVKEITETDENIYDSIDGMTEEKFIAPITKKNPNKINKDAVNISFKSDMELLNNIKKIINVKTLRENITGSNYDKQYKKLIANLINENNKSNFINSIKKVIYKYNDDINNPDDIKTTFETLAKNFYKIENIIEKISDDELAKLNEIAKINQETEAELDEEEQQGSDELSKEEQGSDKPAQQPPAAPEPAAATGEQTDDKAQTSQLTSTSGEADPIDPNLDKKYFIYQDGDDFKLSKNLPENTKEVKVILDTGKVENSDEIEYLGIIPHDGFTKPDGKEAAMTMATSVAGEEKLYATSSLRIEFNKFVAEIKEALTKKDEDFGNLKASIEEIIKKQQPVAEN